MPALGSTFQIRRVKGPRITGLSLDEVTRAKETGKEIVLVKGRILKKEVDLEKRTVPSHQQVMMLERSPEASPLQANLTENHAGTFSSIDATEGTIVTSDILQSAETGRRGTAKLARSAAFYIQEIPVPRQQLSLRKERRRRMKLELKRRQRPRQKQKRRLELPWPKH